MRELKFEQNLRYTKCANGKVSQLAMQSSLTYLAIDGDYSENSSILLSEFPTLLFQLAFLSN